MLEKVSVIVPAFNSEKFLERCVSSIINQTYKNIEIIIIDDASTDNTAEIAKSLSEKYNFIRYFRLPQNGGVSNARNVGLTKVFSEYVVFLDADDWLDLICIEKAVNKMVENKAIDIVIWEIQTAYSKTRISPRYEYQYQNILDSAMALSLLSHSCENVHFLSPLLGCKMFKTNFLLENHLNFEFSQFEDDIFTFLSFAYAQKIALITECNLYYYQHETSITHQFSDKDIETFFEAFISLYKNLERNNLKEYKNDFYNFLCKTLKSMQDRMIGCIQNHEQQQIFKLKIFERFTSNINMSEYYKYCENLYI